MRKLALGAVLFLVVSACSAVSPMPIRTGEGCFQCRKPIANLKTAAQVVTEGMASNFDGSSCLAAYLVEHPQDKGAAFVADFPSGKMIPAGEAIYVLNVNRDNGERTYLAFSNATTAQSEATTRSTSPIAWDALLTEARKAQGGN